MGGLRATDAGIDMSSMYVHDVSMYWLLKCLLLTVIIYLAASDAQRIERWTKATRLAIGEEAACDCDYCAQV